MFILNLYRCFVIVWTVAILALLVHFHLSGTAVLRHEGTLTYYIALLYLGFPFGYAVSIVGLYTLNFMQIEVVGIAYNFYITWSLVFLGGVLQWKVIIPMASKYIQKIFERRKEDKEDRK